MKIRNDGHEKKQKKPMTRAKKVLIVILCIIGALLLWIAGSVIYQIIVNGDYYRMRNEQKIIPKEEHFEYSPVNFGENIFEDEAYLAKNRDIRYIYGAQSTEISLDEDGSFYGDRFVFFQNYFRAIVHGDSKAYRTFFLDEYFRDKKNLAYPEGAFTMQKIYNITLDFRSGATEKVSDTEYKYYYVVKYSLLENNGTFRPDLEPETTVALLYEVTEDGDTRGITKIIRYIDAN